LAELTDRERRLAEREATERELAEGRRTGQAELEAALAELERRERRLETREREMAQCDAALAEPREPDAPPAPVSLSVDRAQGPRSDSAGPRDDAEWWAKQL